MAHNHEESNEGTLGYKALFFGACALLTLLVPGIVGYVINGINETNKVQWERLRELNEEHHDLARAAERHEMEHAVHRQKINDQETRIRELESARHKP